MPYDPIRDSFSESPTIPSRSVASAALSMLLNHDTPPSPSLPTKLPRFDPVHFPDNPSSPSLETPRPSSSSSSNSGYHAYYLSSPAMSGLTLPKPQPSGNFHLSLPSDPPGRERTNSPRSPHVSPVLHPRTLSLAPPVPISPPTRLLYMPRSRVSAEKSVLVPISPQELQNLIRSSRNPLRRPLPPSSHSAIGLLGGTSRDNGDNNSGEGSSTDAAPWSPSRPTSAAAHNQYPSQSDPVSRTRKRPVPEDRSDQEGGSERAKRTTSGFVASHYNARPEVGKIKREESPIIGLKNFNNWIKAVMIAKFARPAIRETNSRMVTTGRRPKYGARVLDLGCGKGGDLNKWGKAEIAAYVGVDIAEVSIEQARARLSERRQLFQADFYDLDCFRVSNDQPGINLHCP
jgi:mRNA (guanine-N7-)-methyltransferase